MSIKLKLYRKKESIKRKINRFKNGSCTVLLYHRVNDLEYDPQGLCVKPQIFEQQLIELKKTHTFITIETFSEILNSKKSFPKNALLITFDDGYADNYYTALPILEKLNLQAVFYIATKNLNTQSIFWWDELDLIFYKININKISVSELIKKYRLNSLIELYNFYLTRCKDCASIFEREALINELRVLIIIEPKHTSNYLFLKTDELIKLSQSKSAIIGAHTINHLSLAHLMIDDQRQEITNSINLLENIILKKIEHFSYPYGEKNNFNQTTINICKELNLKTVAANYCGYVNNKTNVYSFPRFVVRNDHPITLLKKLKEIL